MRRVVTTPDRDPVLIRRRSAAIQKISLAHASFPQASAVRIPRELHTRIDLRKRVANTCESHLREEVYMYIDSCQREKHN